MNYSEQEIYNKAQKRVKKKKGFYSHLGIYLSMAAFFFLMNIANYDGEFWFFMPMIPWGVGLLIHGITTFGLPGGALSKEWEEAELEKEISKERRIRGQHTPPPLELPEDELELREFKKLRREWDDRDFV